MSIFIITKSLQDFVRISSDFVGNEFFLNFIKKFYPKINFYYNNFVNQQNLSIYGIKLI